MRLSALGSCAALLLALSLAGCGVGTSTFSNGTPNQPALSGSSAARVAIVVLENTPYSGVIGNSAAPYLNQLATQYGLATNYFADVHPSIGNYFMMTTGQIVTLDDTFSGTVGDDNLAREITAAGKTWKYYAQSLPSVGYLGGDQFPYLRHHNPFSFFSDVQNNPAQAANMVPASQLQSDISSGSLPNFLFIVPDAQHDAHDCPAGMGSCTQNDRTAAADTWVQQNIAPLISSPSMSNGVVVIVFDESALTDLANGGGHVAAIVAGGAARTGVQSGSFHQHQNLLRLVCDHLSLGACPGTGAIAGSMSEFLQTAP